MRRAFAKQGKIDERNGQSPTRVVCRVVSWSPGNRFRKAADNDEVYEVLKEALRLKVDCVVLQEAHGFRLDDADWYVVSACTHQHKAALFNRSRVDIDNVEVIHVAYLPHKFPE